MNWGSGEADNEFGQRNGVRRDNSEEEDDILKKLVDAAAAISCAFSVFPRSSACFRAGENAESRCVAVVTSADGKSIDCFQYNTVFFSFFYPL